jgi:long-chain acyl-CoA synthetase
MIYTQTVERALRYYPQHIALRSSEHRTTFQEHHERVARVAASLISHGFERGDRLAILLPNDPQYIELIYACSRLGVIAVPLNSRLSPPEIDHVLADASPRGLIRHSSLPVPSVRLPWELVLDQEPLEAASEPAPEAIYDPEAILSLVYTSGTTGRPKGVAVSHANVLANVHFLNYWMPYEEGGVYLHAAPMFHIIDLPLMFAAPAFGTCQVTIPKFNPQHFCETVEREQVTHTALVPTMINLLSQFSDLKKYDLSSLKHLAYGGSPMSRELIRRMRLAFPKLKLVQGYGLTESGFLIGLKDHEHTEDKLLSCGRSCPGIDVRVVDEFGKEVEVGQPGELVARGANVMRGYWNKPDATRAAFRNGMFRTGDVGYQDADGYFYLLDRIKDMIVTGGENVYCGEVEAVISEHPAVQEVAVFGIPDLVWGELVLACVVLKPGTALRADELITHCRRSLANYKIPRRFEFSDTQLPKSGSGKILKRILRERYWTSQKRAIG